MLKQLVRFVREEDGMEMVEWSIVAIVFAVASALLWSTLSDDLSGALSRVGECITSGTCSSFGGGS